MEGGLREQWKKWANDSSQPKSLLKRQSGSPTKKESTYCLSRDVEEGRLLKIMMLMR
jgi:hypothetical protein